jgi:hypothetical protein
MLMVVAVVVGRSTRVLLLYGLPCSAARHGWRMKRSLLSCRVFRGRKSNNNRIHTARSNYMGSRRRTFACALCRAHTPCGLAFDGHGHLYLWMTA